MERRITGIIRWLERCIKAYKNGAVESALMDAECARADIETLRGDLWKKLENRCSTRARRFNSFKAAETFFLAFGILLVIATPLAWQQEELTREDRTEGSFTLEWVTADEKELLSNVRKRPEDSLALAAMPEESIAEPQPASARIAESVEPVRRRSPESPPLRSVPRNESKEPETPLTYDRILSLIETGERAMKNEAPAIKVENTNGK